MSLIFPDYVQLGAHRYKVEFPYHFRERNDVSGQCDNAELSLRVNDREPGGGLRSDTVILHTFWHELIHAIDCVFLQSQISNMTDGEQMVDGLAEGLNQVFCASQLPERFE